MCPTHAFRVNGKVIFHELRKQTSWNPVTATRNSANGTFGKLFDQFERSQRQNLCGRLEDERPGLLNIRSCCSGFGLSLFRQRYGSKVWEEMTVKLEYCASHSVNDDILCKVNEETSDYSKLEMCSNTTWNLNGNLKLKPKFKLEAYTWNWNVQVWNFQTLQSRNFANWKIEKLMIRNLRSSTWTQKEVPLLFQEFEIFDFSDDFTMHQKHW